MEVFYYFWVLDINRSLVNELGLSGLIILPLAVIIAAAIIATISYVCVYGGYKVLLKKLGMYLYVRPDYVAVITSGSKMKVVRNDAFILPWSKVVFVSISLQKIDLLLDGVGYKDRNWDKLSISVTKRPIETNENIVHISMGISDLEMIRKEEETKHALRNYFITVDQKDVDRLKVVEIIKKKFNFDGFELHSVSIMKLV